MQGQYIVPGLGQIYTDRDGKNYCCIRNRSYPDNTVMQKCVGHDEHWTSMVRLSDGWAAQVHGIRQCEDGTIVWNYSSDESFIPRGMGQCHQHWQEDSTDMKQYIYYLDYLCVTGMALMFDAGFYLQRKFPSLSSDQAKAQEVIRTWIYHYLNCGDGGSHDREINKEGL